MYVLLVKSVRFHVLSDLSGIKLFIAFLLLTTQSIVSVKGWIVIARGWMLNASLNYSKLCGPSN